MICLSLLILLFYMFTFEILILLCYTFVIYILWPLIYAFMLLYIICALLYRSANTFCFMHTYMFIIYFVRYMNLKQWMLLLGDYIYIHAIKHAMELFSFTFLYIIR